MLLELKGVSVAYNRVPAVTDVSLSIGEAEIVAIVGANGAGKSTILKAISGIHPISGGEILFEGERISGMDSSRIVDRGIIQVPEGRRVFPYLTVAENLSMGAYSRRARADMAESLEKVFDLFPILKERRTQLAGSLSGGQQQMLAIGRALMAKPRLLMLDEPSLGLAPIVVRTVFEAISEIHKQGTSILLNEQNAVGALQLAHRGYLLATGRLVFTGSADELLKDPRLRTSYLGITEGG